MSIAPVARFEKRNKKKVLRKLKDSATMIRFMGTSSSNKSRRLLVVSPQQNSTAARPHSPNTSLADKVEGEKAPSKRKSKNSHSDASWYELYERKHHREEGKKRTSMLSDTDSESGTGKHCSSRRSSSIFDTNYLTKKNQNARCSSRLTIKLRPQWIMAHAASRKSRRPMMNTRKGKSLSGTT